MHRFVLIPFQINELWGYAELFSGMVIVAPVYSSAEEFSNGYAVVRKGDRFGLVADDGTEALPCLYEEIKRIWDNSFIIESDKKFALFNPSVPSKLSSFYDEWDYVWDSDSQVSRNKEEGVIVVKKNDLCGLYDCFNNRELLPCEYKRIAYPRIGGQRLAINQDSWTILTRDCKPIGMIPDSSRYTDFGCSGEYVFLKSDGKWGIFDLKGNVVVPCRFDTIADSFHNGLIWVGQRQLRDGKWVMNDKFVKDVVTYYYPDMYKAPFNEQTVSDINAWVNNETNGMIPEILDAIPADAVMYLVNAIAFKKHIYIDAQIYEDCTFTNCDGTTSQVTMLHSKENRYFTLGNGQGFIKPYKGRKYSFVAILPDEGVSTEEYLNNISAYSVDFAKDVREAGVEDVIVEMPEFTLDYDIELSDVYKSMGMDIPFDGQRADFTKMLSTASGEPYECWIGRILHKTHIEVDRKGTKAAAATVVEMEAKCTAEEVFTEPRQIILDRPFVYAIVDNETGMPIFLGCQNSFE